MRFRNILGSLILAVCTVLFMSCGNNEASKTEPVNTTEQNVTNPAGDTTVTSGVKPEAADSVSEENGKEKEETKEAKEDGEKEEKD